MCKAVAAAVLGDSAKVNFIPLTTQGVLPICRGRGRPAGTQFQHHAATRRRRQYRDRGGEFLRRARFCRVEKGRHHHAVRVGHFQDLRREGDDARNQPGELVRRTPLLHSGDAVRQRRGDVRGLLRQPLRKHDPGCVGDSPRCWPAAASRRITSSCADDLPRAARPLCARRRQQVERHRAPVVPRHAGGRGTEPRQEYGRRASASRRIRMCASCWG